jgi:RIO-like serine/threonine protein kinase
MMQDQIIQEVEETRAEIARRFDYDVRKIAAYFRERAADRRKKEAENESRSETSPSRRSA